MENRISILIILYLALFFFGNWWLPITDPTENCYALTAKEMLEAGDYFSTRIYGDYWFDKPIFFYWEIVLGYKIFGVSEFGGRFFSGVAAGGVIFVVFQFAERVFGRGVGWVAGVILILTPEFWYVGHAVITDMALLFWMCGSLFCFYIGYSEGGGGFWTAAFLFAGGGVLTKGPVAVLLPGLIILLFLAVEKKLPLIRKFLSERRLFVFLFIIGLWYLPMGVMHGAAFFNQLIGVHNLLRAAVSEHPIFNVWYYYFVVFLIGLLPWQFPPIIFGVKNGFPALNSPNKFLLIWAGVVFFFFQMMATKYPTYTFPYVVPLAILFAQFYVRHFSLFKKIAALMAVFLFLSIFAAIPLIQRNSGKDAAEIILPLSENACVVSYQRIYSGSITFYSGLKMYRLETAANVAKLKPDGISWNAVNVMPFMSFEELPSGKIIAVVDKERVEDFFVKSGRAWRLVAELPTLKIYITDNFF